MGLYLSPEIERRITEEAALRGFATPEAFLLELLAKSTGSSKAQALSDDEFERLLLELPFTEPFPSLPADFSREDIYADHD